MRYLRCFLPAISLLLIVAAILLTPVSIRADDQSRVTVLRTSSEPRLDMMIMRFLRNLVQNNREVDVASSNFLQKYGLKHENPPGSRSEMAAVLNMITAGFEAAGSFFELMNTILKHVWKDDQTTTTSRPTTTPKPEYRKVDRLCEALCNCDDREGNALDTCPPLPIRGAHNKYECADAPTCHINCKLRLISPLDANFGAQNIPDRSRASLRNSHEKPNLNETGREAGKFDTKKYIGLQLYEEHMQEHFNRSMREDIEKIFNLVYPYNGAYDDVSIILNFFHDKVPKKRGAHRSGYVYGQLQNSFGLSFRSVIGHLVHSIKYCPLCPQNCVAPRSRSCPNYKDCGSFMCHCQDSLFGLSEKALARS